MLAPDLTWSAIFAVSIVNPVFEEGVLCGYIITALKCRRSLILAANISIGLRLVCHLYQGPVGVISILPIGIIFTYWYIHTRRLWPPIVAHAILDVLGLMQISIQG